MMPDSILHLALRNIHLEAKIVGIYRQDIYEIPQDAICELIINAAVHRSYLEQGNIQVAICVSIFIAADNRQLWASDI